MSFKRMAKPVEDTLVDTRNEIIMILHESKYEQGHIAFVMNRSKQLVSHIIKKHSAVNKNNQ